MAKSTINQRYIYKMDSSRYKDSNWELNIDVSEAKINEEIVSINDSTALRMIRKMTNTNVSEEEINEIKRKIKVAKRRNKTKAKTDEIRKLYKELEEKTVMFQINSIVFDTISDWNKANSRIGYRLNDNKLTRTIGTSGGVKKNTVLFSQDKIHKDLDKHLDCERDTSKEYIPAKFEAYKALAFSGSSVVTQPKGVLVIEDGQHDIFSDVLLLSDDGEGGFNLSEEKNYKLNRQYTDGCCMISPKLSKQWAIDLGCYKLNSNGEKIATYIPSGFNIRNAFCKGMVFTFPYVEFAEEIAKSYMVKDVWGNMIDIREVELILTTNMLKLWDAYDSIEDYLIKTERNMYEFSVAKILPEKLENVRNMNYQFLQSYEMTDEEIKKLVNPTIESIKGAMSEDYIKTLLFLKGKKLTEDDFKNEEFQYLKALMVEPKLKDDPFIVSKAQRMLKKKINDSKKGVIEVRGSYQIVSGDLYALCQHMFGLEVTGLLDDNEFYSSYWNDKNVKEIVAFRAPMTIHNNIKKMPLIMNDYTEKWFRYMKTCLIVNAWDTTCETMNGEDMDGDANITTDNEILIKNTRQTLPIICEQQSSKKVRITRTNLKNANKNGFNNNVGTVTNRGTNIHDVIAGFKKGTKEYEVLEYRLACMQGYQQEIIDSIKGIVPKKVPKEWYDYQTVKIKDTDSEDVIKEKEFNRKLLANKKPYFFIYNYPKIKRKYNKYIENSNTSCVIRFGLEIKDLERKENKTDEELNFLEYYYQRLPVSMGKSLMNRLCWICEDELDDFVVSSKKKNFDKSILKSHVKYSKKDKKQIEQIYDKYRKFWRNKAVTESDEMYTPSNFETEVYSICNNEDMVCDMLVDICYDLPSSKQFVWDICGDVIVKNLLKKKNNIINVPVQCETSECVWQGDCYELKQIKVEEV